MSIGRPADPGVRSVQRASDCHHMMGTTCSSWVSATQSPAWHLGHRPEAAGSSAALLRDTGRSPRPVGRRTRLAHGERVDDVVVGPEAPASFEADIALMEQGRYTARDLTAALTCSGLAATLMPARNATGCIPVSGGRMPEGRGIPTLRRPHRPPVERTSGVTSRRTRPPPKRSWKQMWSRTDHLHHLFADHVCNRLHNERRRCRCGLVCAPDEELAGFGQRSADRAYGGQGK